MTDDVRHIVMCLMAIHVSCEVSIPIYCPVFFLKNHLVFFIIQL